MKTSIVCGALFSFAVGSLVFFAPVVLGQEQTVRQEPATPSEVLERVRLALAPFSSIEYGYEWESVGLRAGATSNTSRYGNSGEFAYSNGKFFSDYFVTVEDTKSHGYAAFDGELYQRMEGDLSRLFVSFGIQMNTPYVAIQPIMKPCAIFLGYDEKQGLRFDIDSHRSAAIWGPFQKTATLESPQSVHGHPCVVTKFDQGSGKFLAHLELCAATDLNYYPIRVSQQIREGDQLRRRIIEVREFADLKTATGRVIVPLRIETVYQDASGTNLSTEISTIDKTSLKVNEPIPQERFYLKRFRPENISYAANVTPEQRVQYERGPK